jgi:hypothetical protein
MVWTAGTPQILAIMAGWVLALTVGLAAYGCASLREADIRATEDMLAAAGFTMKPADTAEQAANLQSLPPHQLTLQRRNSEPYYVYADPDVCRCVWVGNQQQFSRFQELRLQKQIADEQLRAAQAFRDAAFRWDLWGPWPWRF